MKNEFALAFNEVIEDKQLPKEVILDAIETAMVSAYRRAVNASNAQAIEARIDPETGEVAIFAEKEVVDSIHDERTEVTLEEAQKFDPEVELGSVIIVETTPKDFGRVAAQTARQVIQQKIREAEREAQFNHYASQTGEIINGVVQAIANGTITMGIDMKAEGALGYKDQIPGERFRLHERVRALLLEVKQTPRGPQITLSRSHKNFLRRLLENEVPEIYHGMVEIRSIAREPGQRSKVAVAALKPGVDPVGACVGIRGVRIQTIVRELHDEKIDVIEWNPDPTAYIAKALSPARVSGVYLNELSKGTKTATVIVPEDQLSLAIGRDGQNARLAAKLTGWRIDIKSLPEAVSDLLYKLDNDPEYAPFKEQEQASLSQVIDISIKKNEGRPVTPEEYSILTQFVDRIERSVISRRQQTRKAKDESIKSAKARIPAESFEIPIDELNLSQRICTLLRENGFESVGDLLLQMDLNSDKVLAIPGIGPKAMDDIGTAIAAILVPLESQEPEVVEAEPAADIQEPSLTIVEPEVESAAAEVMPEAVAAEVAPETEEEAEAVPGATLELVETAGIAETAPVELEEPQTLDKLFEIQPEIFDFEEVSEEEDEFLDDSDKKQKGDKKKKKSKKKKFVEIEYDPDHDVVIAKKKHKREDWENLEF